MMSMLVPRCSIERSSLNLGPTRLGQSQETDSCRLEFVRGGKDYENAAWAREAIAGRAILQNISFKKSASGVSVQGQPVIDGLPRILISDSGDEVVSVSPRALQGFRLCQGSWGAGPIQLTLAPGSRGTPLSTLDPGLYVLKIECLGTDLLPVTKEYEVDTQVGTFSCEFHQR